MDGKILITGFSNHKSVKHLFSELSQSVKASISVKGLVGSAKSLVAAVYLLKYGGVNIFILDNKDDAAYFYNDLFQLLFPASIKDTDLRLQGHDSILFFPSSYKRSSKYGDEDSSNIVQRTHVLDRLKNYTGTGDSKMLAVVSYPEAVAEMVVTQNTLQKNTLGLKVGDKLSIDFIREVLTEYDFTRSDFVYEPGQFAIRGGIIDIFSFSANKPYRVEMFGNEVESIRAFDLNTQLSDEKIDAISIVPNLKHVAQTETKESFFEFIDTSTVLWVNNAGFTHELIDNLRDNSDELLDKIISGTSFTGQLKNFRTVYFNRLGIPSKNIEIEFNTVPQPTFNKNFEMLARNFRENETNAYDIYVIAENTNQIERLRAIFGSDSAQYPIKFIPVNISLHEGFIDHQAKLCCYTDHQIFQRYHRFRIRGEVDKSNVITIQELNSLQLGDYVVHIDHGVGVFGGLIKTEVNGKIQEFIKLTYQDNDVLFVNIQGLHRISKFRGKEGAAPKVYKLGTGAWQRLKQKTKNKVKDIAKELIELYAKRKAVDGFAFTPDSFLQHELEASFMYEDTPDQYKATKDVKADMERAYPMDRLVCGDVGFGKTEVAIRAAFKAATDGKQVAVLVPTTILALQHYKTFNDRFKEFPVSIDYISRMKSTKSIKNTLAEVEKGNVNILIGTHRILSKDVIFKDLGLLIVDEEQKFGVAAKERLRQMRLNVDTLTLTATPIPRTLQFSLMGARDLSIITTSPPNRHPIVTEVHTFSETIIKEAIEYEVERGGQVFFLHNRIHDIRDIEDLIRRVCPGIRTVVGHGQMDADQLETVMLDFIEGQYDVLVATTIIESGLDIPNANTIIINQAQNFGLSELHQLRGRVGRSNRKAFCYLLAPPLVSLIPDARRRLKTIEEFSDLGSGFNISMQDLDIRGAGNLLGVEQSGFITEIGFEAYQRILNEAMLELKDENGELFKLGNTGDNLTGGQRSGTVEPTYLNDCYIDTDMEILFPDSYIGNASEKLRLYRELDNLVNDDELGKFKIKLVDRFGPIPQSTEELLRTIRLRHIAIKLGFEKITLKNGLMVLYFISNPKSTYYQTPVFASIIQHVQSCPKLFKVKEGNHKLSIVVNNVNTMSRAINILAEIRK
ncbi:MAG: transcription-repair coupling factor [Prevotellaceae bacterium]|nr:transcription-repair coupling factor [Prevotellaceae bacterium]